MGGPGDATGTKTYLVTFEGAYAATNVGTMSSVAGGLGGGSAAVANASQFQTVTVTASAGTYTLKFQNQETAPTPYNATPVELKAALEALANIAPGDVTVVGGPGDAGRDEALPRPLRRRLRDHRRPGDDQRRRRPSPGPSA